MVTPEARVCDSEECERRVGTGVNVTMMSTTLWIVGVTEAYTRVFRFRKKPMNLCVYDNEDREDGVGTGVNTTML